MDRQVSCPFVLRVANAIRPAAPQHGSSRPHPPLVAACAGVRLLLRALVAVGLSAYLDSRDPPRRFLIAGDAEGYWDLAGDIATGGEYAVYTPPRRVLRMPGFPALLALPRLLFGDTLLPARLWLAVVGTFAVWGVWRLGAELLDATTGLIAAALAAVAPVLVLFAPVELSETAFAAGMLVSLIGAARLLRRHGVGDTAPAPRPLRSNRGAWRNSYRRARERPDRDRDRAWDGARHLHASQLAACRARSGGRARDAQSATTNRRPGWCDPRPGDARRSPPVGTSQPRCDRTLRPHHAVDGTEPLRRPQPGGDRR